MAFPYPAIATLKYKPPPGSGTPFAFNKGDRLTVLGLADDDGDWLEGETSTGDKGVFPATFVQQVDDQSAEQKEESIVEGGEDDSAAPLEQSIAAGVEQSDADFPSTNATHTTDAPASATEPAPVVDAPAPPPPAVPSSPPALSSGAETITDGPRPTASSPPASASGGPPPPAKKPSGLASRLAFFQQAAADAAPTPPVPRPKPAGVGGWKRPAAPAAAPAPAPAASPGAASAPGEASPSAPSASSPAPPAMARTASSDSSSAAGEGAGFSAADAQESIGRGGGSLRERIAALQGGLRMDQPGAPGRAPKPWRRKTEEVAEEEEGGEKEEGEQETQVKDDRPTEEETTAQSPGAEVPGFEPAEPEPAPEETAKDAPAEAAEEDSEAAAAVPVAAEQVPAITGEDDASPMPQEAEEKDDMESKTSVPPISTGRETITDSPAPAASAPESASSSSAPTAFADRTDDAPAPAQEKEDVEAPEPADEEDAEEARRAALAKRMASLGGQRVGLPMPALPKRAAGPKRNRGARSPAAAPAPAPPEVEVEEKGVGAAQEVTKEEEKAVVDEPVQLSGAAQVEEEVVQPAGAASAAEEKEEEKDKEDDKGSDVLASMGGASALLARDDDSDDERAQAPGEEDDFDTPAPPKCEVAPPAPAPAAANEGDDQVGLEADDAPAPPPSEGNIAEQVNAALLEQSDELDIVEPAPEEPAPAVGEEEEEEASAPPPPPTRAVDPPTDESRPAAEAPDVGEYAVPPAQVPKGRPPVPPPFVRTPTAASAEPEPEQQQQEGEDDDPHGIHETHAAAMQAARDSAAAPKPARVMPPIPTHPPPEQKESVITPAERAIIESQPEILSPPEEAADESTTGVDVDAPSIRSISAERHEMPDADQPHERDAREEGVATPAAVERSPPVMMPNAAKPAQSAQVKKLSLDAQEGAEDQLDAEAEEEGSEEEEEEDPEIARRRALAARMAKLGGRGMGPMLGFGGLPPAPPKKAKKKSVRQEEERQPSEQLKEQVESGSEGTTPAEGHPPRRVGGIPMGGFALPGMAAPRPPRSEPEENVDAKEQEQHVQPAADEDIAPEDRGVPEEPSADGPAPPPLPPNRPSTGPPRRSIPVPPPAASQDEDREHGHVDPVADEDDQYEPVLEASHDEPQQYVDEPEAHEEEGEMAPPPPPRPAGGHTSPSMDHPSRMASISSVSSRPPARVPPLPQSDAELTRSPTQGSQRSAYSPRPVYETGSARPSLDLGAYAHGGQQQYDADEYAQGHHEGGVPPAGYDSGLVQPAAEASSASRPPERASLDALLQWSATLGAQVFAAAHVLKSSSARGLTDEQFVDKCLEKATEPWVPAKGEYAYGVRVYEAVVEQGKKGALVQEDDEPRAGDVAVISAKFKHALSTKTVGSDSHPHVAVVVGWEAKKGKLKVHEVDAKSGAVDENSYKVDDLKAGKVVVYRVTPRE
ncbi:hypothetical protein JCM10207_002411 [Rhodosporidiobolus poonsookiae]